MRVSAFGPADVVVTTRGHAAAALGSGARAAIVVGRGGRRALRRRMPVCRRFIALPGPITPHVIIPADRGRVASYAIRNWASPESRLRRQRNELALRAIEFGAFPDLPRSLTVGLDEHAPPFLVAAAQSLGVPCDADWFLTLGLGDPLTRAAFQLFAVGENEPGWVLKFSRVAGYTRPFDRDERGLRLATEAGGPVAKHTPRTLGRFDVGGLPASLEEAAVGRKLTYLLQTPGRRAEKLRAIDAVADWIVEVGRETAASPAALAAERRRLETEVVPQWRAAGVPADLVSRVGEVPAVLQHNDLGCWNLVVGPHGFTAVDWESARPAGFPLWDLVYFLVDALIHLDGAWHEADRERYALSLMTGDAASSAIFFRWLRKAVDGLAVPAAAVGPIVTLGWLHHGLSGPARVATAEALAPGGRRRIAMGDWMVRLWLRHPGLGVTWDAWAR